MRSQGRRWGLSDGDPVGTNGHRDGSQVACVVYIHRVGIDIDCNLDGAMTRKLAILDILAAMDEDPRLAYQVLTRGWLICGPWTRVEITDSKARHRWYNRIDRHNGAVARWELRLWDGSTEVATVLEHENGQGFLVSDYLRTDDSGKWYPSVERAKREAMLQLRAAGLEWGA